MKRYAFRKICACLLLAILCGAYTGHKVHIFTEDPLHFAAFCADLAPDNGAEAGVVEKCIVDDYHFFPFLEGAPFAAEYYCCMLALMGGQAVCCKLSQEPVTALLRAPPAA